MRSFKRIRPTSGRFNFLQVWFHMSMCYCAFLSSSACTYIHFICTYCYSCVCVHSLHFMNVSKKKNVLYSHYLVVVLFHFTLSLCLSSSLVVYLCVYILEAQIHIENVVVQYNVNIRKHQVQIKKKKRRKEKEKHTVYEIQLNSNFTLKQEKSNRNRNIESFEGN